MHSHRRNSTADSLFLAAVACGSRPRLIGIDEAAFQTGLSTGTLRNWCYSGKLTSHKLGRRLLVSAESLDELIRTSECPRRDLSEIAKQSEVPALASLEDGEAR